jgi:hypothetical protein
MKRLFLFLVFLQIGVCSYSQLRAIELKTYCFGNTEHNLITKLSPQSKLELEKVLQKNNIEKTFLYNVKYEEVFSKYTTEKYLSSHTYKYINWQIYNGIIKSDEYIGFNGYNVGKPNKLIVLYSTNDNNIERLQIYILN